MPNHAISAGEGMLAGAAAHGFSQGAISALQGGSFWQGAATGAVSSIIAGGAARIGGDNPLVISAVTLASGGVSGGLTSMMTGGDFWDGAKTGLIVAGLNHLGHMTHQRYKIDGELEAVGINPGDPAEVNVTSVEDVLKTKSLSSLYRSGGKPTLEVTGVDNGDDFAGYFRSSHTIKFWNKAFTSYRKLALVTGHELNHATHWYSGQRQRWIQVSNETTAKNFSEFKAYSWQFYFGGNYIPSTEHNMNFYKKHSFKLFGE